MNNKVFRIQQILKNHFIKEFFYSDIIEAKTKYAVFGHEVKGRISSIDPKDKGVKEIKIAYLLQFSYLTFQIEQLMFNINIPDFSYLDNYSQRSGSKLSDFHHKDKIINLENGELNLDMVPEGVFLSYDNALDMTTPNFDPCLSRGKWL